MEKKEIKVLCFCRDFSSVIEKKKLLINNSKLGLREDISFRDVMKLISIVHRNIKRNNDTGVLEKNEQITYNYHFITFDNIDQDLLYVDGGLGDYYLSNLCDQFDNNCNPTRTQSVYKLLRESCLGVCRYNEKTEEFVLGEKKWLGSLYNELQQ